MNETGSQLDDIDESNKGSDMFILIVITGTGNNLIWNCNNIGMYELGSGKTSSGYLPDTVSWQGPGIEVLGNWRADVTKINLMRMS